MKLRLRHDEKPLFCEKNRIMWILPTERRNRVAPVFAQTLRSSVSPLTQASREQGPEMS